MFPYLEEPDKNVLASMQGDSQFVGVELSSLTGTVPSSKSPLCATKFRFLKLETMINLED